MSEKVTPTGLALLRVPFPAHQISRLPKPTKRQTEEVKANFKAGIRCKECGQWHHPDVVHLDYVGHAALTDRLLEADPAWNWDFAAANQDGTPIIDKDGGIWIRLTVCGVTRLGYGDAPDKTGGNAMKERIGDALRNAAMRFGAALDLWHKGELHVSDDDKGPGMITATHIANITALIDEVKADKDAFLKYCKLNAIEDMPLLQYPSAIKALEAKRKSA